MEFQLTISNSKRWCCESATLSMPANLESSAVATGKEKVNFHSHPKEVKVIQSCLTLCDPMDYTVHGTLQARTLELGSLSFLQGIFPTQGLNSGLPHCRQSLYQLSHKGSPKILEWVAYPFSRGSSWPRNWTGVSCIAGGFFPNWVSGKPFESHVDLYLLISFPPRKWKHC